MPAHLNAYAAILAGGIGARFWPASTPDRPKQLLPLAGSRPLIDETLDRAVRLVGSERVLVVTSEGLARRMDASLERTGVRALKEPRPRGTGPALAWAAHEIERAAPGAVMISMHADHRIEPFEGLYGTLERAIELARDGYLCCLGVRPDRPETGYGYVRPGEPLARGAWRVARFVEKPDEATAERYVASGEHLWNTGIFVWRAADLLDEIRRHAPEIARALPRLEADGDVSGFFEESEAVSVDVSVMERAGRVATLEADFAWDDLGVWGAVARARGVDEAGNAVVGSARALEAHGNVVWTESLRANLIGVDDLVVVEANGELLVMPRERAPDLKRLVRALEEASGR